MAAFPWFYARTVWCHRPAVLGWQAGGVTSQREAWELKGRRCVGGFMAGGALAVNQRLCSGIWNVRRLGGCF